MPTADPTPERLLPISVEHRDGIAIIRPRGEIDLFNAGVLQTALTGQLQGGSVHVVLDLEDVTFVDSTALGIFVRAHERALSEHTVFSLVLPHRRLSRLATMMGLDQVLNMYESLDAAIATATAER
jgi:anti-sigma B factor antagonist